VSIFHTGGPKGGKVEKLVCGNRGKEVSGGRHDSFDGMAGVLERKRESPIIQRRKDVKVAKVHNKKRNLKKKLVHFVKGVGNDSPDSVRGPKGGGLKGNHNRKTGRSRSHTL